MKKMYTFFLAVFLLGSTVIAQNMNEIVHKYLNNHAGKSEVGFTTQDISEYIFKSILFKYSLKKTF